MTLVDHTHTNDYATAVDNAIAQLYAVPDDNGNVLLDLTPDIGPLPANMDLPPVSWTAAANGVTFASGTVTAGGPTTLTLPNCPAAFNLSIRVANAHMVGDNTPIVLTSSVTTLNLNKADLRVDTNRDNEITAADETGKNAWTTTSGAIILPNCDRDNTNTGSPDNWAGGMYGGKFHPANNVIDSGDLGDVGPLWFWNSAQTPCLAT